jgi:hypothetical protein
MTRFYVLNQHDRDAVQAYEGIEDEQAWLQSPSSVLRTARLGYSGHQINVVVAVAHDPSPTLRS